MTKQLKSLFSQLCYTLDMQESKEKDYLILDHNSIYGGYVIMIVHPTKHYSQSHFIFSSRMSSKEMVAMIQGMLHAYTTSKQGDEL